MYPTHERATHAARAPVIRRARGTCGPHTTAADALRQTVGAPGRLKPTAVSHKCPYTDTWARSCFCFDRGGPNAKRQTPNAPKSIVSTVEFIVSTVKFIVSTVKFIVSIVKSIISRVKSIVSTVKSIAPTAGRIKK
jgi:hypothetical protein